MKLTFVIVFIIGIQLVNPIVEKIKQYEDSFYGVNISIQKMDHPDIDDGVKN